MKRRIVAFVTVLAMMCSMLGFSAIANAAGTFAVQVKSGNQLTVTITGDFGAKDWVGIYRKGETTDPTSGGKTSLLWWYINDATKTLNWPADKAKADATNNNAAAANRAAEINSDYTLQDGDYYAVILENDSYTPKAGYDKFEFSVKQTNKFFISFDPIEGAPYSAPFGGPTVQKVTYQYKNGDSFRFVGWLGGTFDTAAQFVYTLNGGAETTVPLNPAEAGVVAAIKGNLSLSKNPTFAARFDFNLKDVLAAADNGVENVVKLYIKSVMGALTQVAEFKTISGVNPALDLYTGSTENNASKKLNNGYVTYSPIEAATWDPYISYTKKPATTTTNVAIKYRANPGSTGMLTFYIIGKAATPYSFNITADGEWHTYILTVNGALFGTGFAFYRLDIFDNEEETCKDKSIDIAWINFYTSQADAEADAQKVDLLSVEKSYQGASIRKTLVAYEKDGIVDKADMRQGLRFCFDDIAKVGDQIQFGSTAVTVTGVKALIARRDACTDAELKIGSVNSNVKVLDEMISWELGGKNYASSYIYNIPKTDKDTVIVSRAAITAKDASNNEYVIYSDIQSASVSGAYRADAGLNAQASAWFQ